MPWTIKRWWKTIGLVTLALEILCLIIGPNPLSIGLIPVGMLLLGLAGPSVIWGLKRVADTSQDGTARFLGGAGAFFAFGIAKLGFDLAWVGVAVAIAIRGQELNGS